MNKKTLISKLVCRYAKNNNLFNELRKILTYNDINKIACILLSHGYPSFFKLVEDIKRDENVYINLDALNKLNQTDFDKLIKKLVVDTVIKEYFKQHPATYEDFVYNIKHNSRYASYDRYITSYINNVNVASFITHPFLWSNTDEGWSYWRNVSVELNMSIKKLLINND